VNVILLAAGYGTRLYPLTRDRPKSLLPVGGRPIIDYLVEELETLDGVHAMHLVSNARFADQFRAWQAARQGRVRVEILDDGSTTNDDRLGAVADVRFAMDSAGLTPDETYVVATDNLPRFHLCDAVLELRRTGENVVFACPAERVEDLRRMGVAELDGAGRIVSFEEKPEHPKGRFRVPPFYAYTPRAAGLIGRYLDEGNNPDAPGHYLAWLVGHEPVRALVREAGTLDIGTPESYAAVQAEFSEGRGTP
jgi:glucose-1-phosphate thymidylyltransferase